MRGRERGTRVDRGVPAHEVELELVAIAEGIERDDAAGVGRLVVDEPDVGVAVSERHVTRAWGVLAR